MRRGLIAWLALLLLAGCGRAQPPAGHTPVGGTPAPASDPVVTAPKAPVDAGTAKPPAQPDKPAESQGPTVERVGDAIRLTGTGNGGVLAVAWSPTGKQAVFIMADPPDYARTYGLLLDMGGAAPTIRALAGMVSTGRPQPGPLPLFWSKDEVLWQQQDDGDGSRLLLRNLGSGQDRELYRFTGPVYPAVRPGDTTFSYVRFTGEPHWVRYDVASPRGEVWVGQVGTNQAVKVWEQGWLVGRLADGRTLAVQGAQDHDLLAVIDPKGAVTWLAKSDAVAPALSADGRQALWFTNSNAPTAGAQPSPLADTLWRWDGTAPPVALSLGGLYRAEGTFSPDGRQIVLSLGDQDPLKPSRLAVVEGHGLRTLRTADTYLSVVLFDGQMVAYAQAYPDKTGGEPAYSRIDLAGKELGRPLLQRGNALVDWQTAGLVLHWRGSAATRLLRDTQCSPHGGLALTDPYVICFDPPGYTLQPLLPVTP